MVKVRAGGQENPEREEILEPLEEPTPERRKEPVRETIPEREPEKIPAYEGVVQGGARDGPRQAAEAAGLREVAASLGGRAHLRVDLPQSALGKGPRVALRHR